MFSSLRVFFFVCFRNDYYSGQWVTLTFDSLLKWIECNQVCKINSNISHFSFLYSSVILVAPWLLRSSLDRAVQVLSPCQENCASLHQGYLHNGSCKHNAGQKTCNGLGSLPGESRNTPSHIMLQKLG